jgi:hypothetical protein
VRLSIIRLGRHRLAVPLDCGHRIILLKRYQAHQMECLGVFGPLRKHLAAKFGRLVEHAGLMALGRQFVIVIHCHPGTVGAAFPLVNRVLNGNRPRRLDAKKRGGLAPAS